MLLIRFDIFQGRNADQIKALMDTTHRALVAALGIPEHDRYQIVREHPRSHFIVEDTGLGIKRTSNFHGSAVDDDKLQLAKDDKVSAAVVGAELHVHASAKASLTATCGR